MPVSRHLTVWGLLVAMAMVFAVENVRDTSFAEVGGAVPAKICAAANALWHGEFSLENLRVLSTLVTCMFLHGDVEHILWNSLLLWTFGILISDILGQWRTLAIFLITGVCGSVLHVALKDDSTAPMVGASGAVAGLTGVYLGLALRWQLPWAEVWPLAFPVQPIHLAFLAIVGFIIDLVRMSNHDPHIAYGAHLGGFLSGLLVAAIITTIYPTLYAYERSRRKDCI